MEDLKNLDDEEIMLLLGSCLSVIFTFSFLLSFFKVFKHQIKYTHAPILVISFGYIDNLVWYYYSDLIFHDYMKKVHNFNYYAYIVIMLIYIRYEFKEDKIDSILNILIIITVSWAIKKLMADILTDEDKAKYCCAFSYLSLLVTILEWIIRAYKQKNLNILNIFSASCLMCISVCWIVFGLIYEELFFFIPNIIGLIISCIYFGIWFYLRKKYRNYIQEDFKDIEEDDNNSNENREVNVENENRNSNIRNENSEERESESKINEE